MNSFFLYNARYLGEQVSLEVQDGRIASLRRSDLENFPHGVERVNAEGKLLFPSFIDAHAHLRDPGYVWKETISTGLEAAVRGGFGSVLCMANTNPVNDTALITRSILSSAREAFPAGPKLYPIGAATVGLKGERLSPMRELAEAGCAAFSNDGMPVGNTELFRRILEYASDLGRIVIDHCEDPFLGSGACMNEGVVSGDLGLPGQPDVTETIQATRSILLAEYLDVPVHIAHVSAKRTVDAIAWGKSRGVKVTAETCPHYLLLDETAVLGYNSLAKVSPPLRAYEDMLALRQGVKDGVIELLATDHAPHSLYEKEPPFDTAANGFTGFDTAVSVVYDLVRQGVFSEELLVERWAFAPARTFNLPVNRFSPGDPADFFLFDPNFEWVVSPETLYSKSANTPWLGKTLKGKVAAHWIDGHKVF